MHVDDADQLATGHQRHRQKRVVGVFRQRLKRLEPRVGRGVRRQRHDRLVQRHPAGDSFAHLQADIADLRVVRQLRSAQHDLATRVIDQIDQAGVAGRHLKREAD